MNPVLSYQILGKSLIPQILKIVQFKFNYIYKNSNVSLSLENKVKSIRFWNKDLRLCSEQNWAETKDVGMNSKKFCNQKSGL